MPATSAIRQFDPNSVTEGACVRAALILKHTHESARAILNAYCLVRSSRAGNKAVIGTSTNEEQDLLRAMLVMSGAGLDSMTKQLVRDALPFIVHEDERARGELESFIQKCLTQDFEALQEGRKVRFTAGALASKVQRVWIVQQYVDDLTAGSLQSAAELRKIVAAFGLTQELITIDFQSLQEIFRIRNQIIHELDINLDATRRNRNNRAKGTMVRDTNQLLSASQDLLEAVNQQLCLCLCLKA